MHLITVHTIFDHNRVILEIEKLRGDTCNCDGTIIFEHESDFPDYESCRKKCIGTEGCHYFGIWEPNKHYKGYCRLWNKCGSCNKAERSNKVYQLSTGINFILL